MENYVPRIEDVILFEKKGEKRKSEREYVQDRYSEYNSKITKKRADLREIEQSDASSEKKMLRSKIKKNEITILEKQIDIARLREENDKLKDELKNAD